MARTRERNFVQLVGKFTNSVNLGAVAKPDLEDIKRAGFLDEVTSVYK